MESLRTRKIPNGGVMGGNGEIVEIKEPEPSTSFSINPDYVCHFSL